MKSISVFLMISIGIVNGNICPENYNSFADGKCYRVLGFGGKIASARFECLNDGATLPIIHNIEENQVLTALVVEFGINAWLGITCSSSGCSWDDGSPYDYQNFVNGSPNVTYGNCAYLSNDNSKPENWNSTDCNFDLKQIICQKDADTVPTCKAPFSTGADGRCYYLSSFTLNFDNAEGYCKKYGADMVSIQHDFQNSIVEELGKSSNGTEVTEVFIGLFYNGIYYNWSDPQAVYNYSNWATGYPNNNIGSCVIMNIGGLYDGQWRNIDCSDGLFFVCS
ncbi:hypothetical protein FO519_007896, partial [Halicephalobus sp. NKZ332]